jgi:fructose/tagatose bisphosphate aldolase
MDFKLGFGPMSREVISAICNFSHERQYPLMIIASRNQIDAESGYVMTTPQLRQLLDTLPTDHVRVCRDHCGPYFLDSEKNLSLRDAIEATKKTIAYDIEQGFDLIHIDTSRVEDTYGVAAELFEFSVGLNPNLRFEFGTEENVGVTASIDKYRQDVAFAKNMPNIEFVVAQTGSLCFEDTQAGTFDMPTVETLVAVANENGVRLKEHNADYLTAEQVQLRRTAGVHAMNIAPQLGVVQTKVLMELCNDGVSQAAWQLFADKVLASNRWSKWTQSTQDAQRTVVAGHYCFNSIEYQNLKSALNIAHDRVDERIRRELYRVFELYAANITC